MRRETNVTPLKTWSEKVANSSVNDHIWRNYSVPVIVNSCRTRTILTPGTGRTIHPAVMIVGITMPPEVRKDVRNVTCKAMDGQNVPNWLIEMGLKSLSVTFAARPDITVVIVRSLQTWFVEIAIRKAIELGTVGLRTAASVLDSMALWTIARAI